MVKEITEDSTEEKNSHSGVYEIGYIIVPTVAEENLGAEVEALKDLLAGQNISLISEEYPKMIELAYEMSCSIANKKQKFSSGYFGWIKFECDSSQAKNIKQLFDKNEKLVRYLMIKTVRENTMSARKSYNKQDSPRRRFVPKIEENLPINEETLDKEIDALVAE